MNVIPEPATRSLTVDDTRTSLGPASADTGGAHTPQAWRREGCQRSHPKMGLFGHDQSRDWGPRTLRALPELECIDLLGQVAAVQ